MVSQADSCCPLQLASFDWLGAMDEQVGHADEFGTGAVDQVRPPVEDGSLAGATIEPHCHFSVLFCSTFLALAWAGAIFSCPSQGPWPKLG